MDIVKDFLANPEVQTALVNLILAVVSVSAAALSRAVLSFVRTRTNEWQFQLLQNIASSAVLAAEQAGLAGRVQDKKKSAFNVINAHLRQMGLTAITAEQVDAAIEAAVLSNLNYSKTQRGALPFELFPLPTPVENEGEDSPAG